MKATLFKNVTYAFFRRRAAEAVRCGVLLTFETVFDRGLAFNSDGSSRFAVFHSRSRS